MPSAFSLPASTQHSGPTSATSRVSGVTYSSVVVVVYDSGSCCLAVGDSAVYRLSKERTMVWLQKKVSILAEKLEKEKVYVGTGSISSAMADSNQLEVKKSQSPWNYLL